MKGLLRRQPGGLYAVVCADCTATFYADADNISQAEQRLMSAGWEWTWGEWEVTWRCTYCARRLAELDLKNFIADIHHIAWVAYQIAACQPYNSHPTNAQRASLLNGVEAFLDNPKMTPEEDHANWMRYKIADGWVHGLFKDGEKTHPDLVPFDELPDVEQRKDIMNVAVRRLAMEVAQKYSGVVFDSAHRIV